MEHYGENKAVFTGDTLFIGDCGRPDLREATGNVSSDRAHLAQQMYHSLRDKILPLGDKVLVYPAHGAGTLCGKSVSDAKQSTVGKEKNGNWSLQDLTGSRICGAANYGSAICAKVFQLRGRSEQERRARYGR